MARKSKKTQSKLIKYRKYIAISAAAALVIIGGVVALAVRSGSGPKTTAPPSPAAKSATKAATGGASYSTTPLNGSEVNTDNNSRKASPTPPSTLDSGGSSNSLMVTLTGISTVGNSVHISTLINGASSGTCSLTASLSGHADITASSSIVQNVNNYQCDDFGLTTSQFASGDWHFVVTATSGGMSATDTNDKQLP